MPERHTARGKSGEGKTKRPHNIKKRRARGPGESNREASRLGDVGSRGSRVSNAISRNLSCRRPGCKLLPRTVIVSVRVLDTDMRVTHALHQRCNTTANDG